MADKLNFVMGEKQPAQTEPLNDFYEAKGILVTVEGQDEVADTTALVLAALDKVQA